jgi:hypothetical protein
MLCTFLEEYGFNVDSAFKKIWKHFLLNPKSASFRDIFELPKTLYELLGIL